MPDRIQYVHTNLIAKDWRKLAQFYIDVFGCRPLYPERDLQGEWVAQLTGIEDVRIQGIHLRLPGNEAGPTLEIFGYQPDQCREIPPAINHPGFGHIAFHVDSVEAVLSELTAHGGKALGKVVRKEYETIGLLTAVYARDPEGNIIEIQNWQKRKE